MSICEAVDELRVVSVWREVEPCDRQLVTLPTRAALQFGGRGVVERDVTRAVPNRQLGAVPREVEGEHAVVVGSYFIPFHW